MSLESAMDEERLEVLALLEGKTPPSRQIRATARARGASPAGAAQSPVRSMLDVGGTSPAVLRHASIAGQGVGITSAPSTSQPIRSMLDPHYPPSRQAVSPPVSHQPPRINVEKEYNFEILPTNEHGSLPKRVAQGGKAPPARTGGGIFHSYDSNSRSDASKAFHGKHQQSHSPSFFGRQSSPKPARKLNNNFSSLMLGPNSFLTDGGQVIDMSTAYRRLSDANLLKSGSGLLPNRKGSDPTKGESMAPDGSIRLTKDYDMDDDDAIDSSDGHSDSSDEEWGGEASRGRGRTRDDDDDELVDDNGLHKRQPKSLLAAAEAERKSLIANQKITSLLDPEITGIDIDGKPTHAKRTGVHPNTSYDMGDSEMVSPNDSGEEEMLDDIAKAQSLSLRLSKINSDPSKCRCMRTILRGDYGKIEEDAKQGLRRQRLYMVATDLSDEAAYALEWTIGTVLRDGDTLFAVYAMDISDVGGDSADAHSTSSATNLEQQNAPSSGDGAKLMESTYKMVRVLSNTVESTIPAQPSALDPRRSLRFDPSTSRPSSGTRFGSFASPDTRGTGRAERERLKAVAAITDRCVHLLRKTKLQIRIIIDVLHCKSPKHIITEVIDYLTPTLVILGSRGRSSVKNVLLGSFSNYLVTKSSVPVMVARKKLKKSKSFKRSNIRLSNVLQPSASRKLANANIEKAISRSSI